MTRKLPLLILGAAALAACDTKPETITARDEDPMAEELAKAAPVELPPAIASSKTYRCKDNSLVKIDWLQDGKGAHVTPGDAPAPISLAAPAPVEGQPASTDLVGADGTKLAGDAKAASVTLTLPGKGAQSCKA
jgi:hypothetical protein